jgi:hypothetical protein
MHRKFRLSTLFLTSVLLPWFLAPVQAGKYSSGGGRTYSSSSSRSSSSSSSSSFSKPSTPAPSTSRPAASVPAPRPSSATSSYSTPRSSYSSGTAPASSSSFSRPASAAPASSNSIDSAAAKAKQMQQSAQNFAQSRPAPLPASPASRASSQPLPPLPPRSSYASRGYATSSNLNSYPQSTTRVVHHYPAFSSYYSRPVVIYHDSYSSPFWYWLLDQPRPVRAAWYYNHQTTMDPARQAALVAADPALTQDVTQLAATAPTPDPNYTPPGIEPQAMTAPVEVEATSDELPADASSQLPMSVTYGSVQRPLPGRSSSWFSMAILLGGSALVIWLVFFKRWKPARA